MKTRGVFLTVLLAVFSFTLYAAQTAQMHFVCLSLRVHPGSDGSGNTLALSSVSGTPNGELYLSGGGAYASGMSLDSFGFPVPGALQVYLPPFVDSNGNGFDDFFEIERGVALSFTVGSYSTSVSDGSITASWSRAAGSKDGTCVFHLEDDDFGDLGNFTHVFEVLEFAGPLTYTPASSNVISSLNLTQTGNPLNTLRGPAVFSKTVPGNFNYLVLRAGHWTNAAAQTLSFDGDDVNRDLLLRTNYYGYMAFDDGDPGTAGYDYPFWQISIDDLNDSDVDTIPDFSDSPIATPRRPVLSLARGSTNLWLTISGEVGRLHHVLANTNLANVNWPTNLSLTLTNDPQTISLPLPTQPRFWRVWVP